MRNTLKKSSAFTLVVLCLMLLVVVLPMPTHAFDSTDILLEYGAESGVLQPPWDEIGPHGGGSHELSKTVVDDTHARTGTYSMYNYVCPPPKSDAQRRISNRYYSHDKDEFYLSFWIYFDDHWNNIANESPNVIVGGQSLWWYDDTSGVGHNWWTGARFKILAGSGNIVFYYSWHGINVWSPTAWDLSQQWNTGISILDHLNTWIRFQTYVKFTTDNTGAISGWVTAGGTEYGPWGKTNIKTSPEGYPEWISKGGHWTRGSHPWILMNLYGSLSGFETWTWVDDVVMSTTKVPEAYGVDSDSPPQPPVEQNLGVTIVLVSGVVVAFVMYRRKWLK